MKTAISGSRIDAEDLVLDVYLRWRQSASTATRPSVALLLAVITRLCRDALLEPKHGHKTRAVALGNPRRQHDR